MPLILRNMEINKIMQNIQKTIWLILTILLSSCVQSTTPQIVPSVTIASTASSTQVPSLVSTATPTYPPLVSNLVTVTPTYFAPMPTESYQQVYIDPACWFSVNLPANWESTSVNVFSGEDGFFETGYLPQMMYMPHTHSVCDWLANINTNSVYGVFFSPSLYLNHNANACMLKSMPDITPANAQAIIENPNVNAERRFFYIKTDAEHFDEIIETFAWLRPAERKQELEFKLMPVRPEDTIFWENAVLLSSKFLVKEYALPPELQNESPYSMAFSRFKPIDVPTMESKINDKPSINEQLKTYGYEVRIDPNGITSPQLYKDGNILFDNISLVQKGVYTFSTSTKPIFAFIVDARKKGCYLIQNDELIEWGNCFNDPYYAPILYKGKLLWLRAIDFSHIQVETSRRDEFFSFATSYGSRWPVTQFSSWNDHWILGIGDFLIQDGEIINEKFGFEEIFEWHIVNDKPFYFFRKGPKIGISYDENFLLLDYEKIAHGISNNPVWIDENTVRFYGRRDGTWYYVIAEVN